MNLTTIVLIIACVAAIAAALAFTRYNPATVCNFLQSIGGKRAGLMIANAITAVNITPKGRATYLGDVQFTSRYLLCKPGSDVNHIAISGAADKPSGVVNDMTPTSDPAGDFTYWLPVDLLGMCEDTIRVQANGAIAVGAFCVPAANGQVATDPGSGAGYCIGRAKTAAGGAGDIFEMIPTFPIKVAVFPY